MSVSTTRLRKDGGVGPPDSMIARIIAITGVIVAVPSPIVLLLIWRWQRRKRQEVTS